MDNLFWRNLGRGKDDIQRRAETRKHAVELAAGAKLAVVESRQEREYRVMQEQYRRRLQAMGRGR